MTESMVAHGLATKEEAWKRGIEMLALVGIPKPEERMHDYPHQYSGGMRQRVMIAMALSCSPELVIADEPTTSLDVTVQAQILELMKELKSKLKSSIIVISHDLSIVAGMADKVVVMYAGRMVEEADVFDLYEKPGHPYTIGLMKSVPRSMPRNGNVWPHRREPPGSAGAAQGMQVRSSLSVCHEDLPGVRAPARDPGHRAPRQVLSAPSSRSQCGRLREGRLTWIRF